VLEGIVRFASRCASCTTQRLAGRSFTPSWSLEHSSSCTLKGVVRVAARRASGFASEFFPGRRQLPHGRVSRRRASEVQALISYLRGLSEEGEDVSGDEAS